MRLNRPLTAVLCLLIVSAGWLPLFLHGHAKTALASGLAISALCIALVFLRWPTKRPRKKISFREEPREESMEFRRGLFDLCAGLRLSIGFCEKHLEGEPELLLGELEEMADNLRGFINEIARPVKLSASPRRHWHLGPRIFWPWRLGHPRPR